MTAMMLVTIMGMAALAIDAGMLYTTRAELQVAADAAALAGAHELLDSRRLLGDSGTLMVFDNARNESAAYAALNKVLKTSSIVDTQDDVSIGYIDNIFTGNPQMTFVDMDRFNAVQVTVRRNEIRNGPVSLWFAQVFGLHSANLGAEATAAFTNGIESFRVTDRTGNAGLIPFAIEQQAWDNLVGNVANIGDNYAYDEETGTVSPGSDGIYELNIYPGAGSTQLAPGNFGTVDIGAANNSTSDLARQIVHGVNASDLAHLGGALTIPTWLNGDTGLSAGMKDELESIIGQPRTLPVFDQLSGGNGNNSDYHIVKFAGVRIMYVKLTGSMSKKSLIIQPAFVTDAAAVGSTSATESDFVFTTVRLVK